MNTWERMQEPFPEFDINGNVDYTCFDEKRFFLVDDNSTTGRIFNGLAYFIQENGGEVVGRYAITAGNDESEKMTVTNATWEEIERLGVDNVREFAEQNNVKQVISRDGLTEREANELVRQYRKNGGSSDSGVARVGEGLQEVYGRTPGTSGKNRNDETETLNEAPV